MMRAILASAFVAALLVGCSGNSTTGPSSETGKKAVELYEAMKKDTQKQLEGMDAKLKEWKESVDKASGDAKVAMEKRYNELKAERDKFAEQVNEFGKSSADAWEKMKDGIQKASSNLADSFNKAADEFK